MKNEEKIIGRKIYGNKCTERVRIRQEREEKITKKLE